MSLGLVILHFALYGCIDDWNLTFYCESLPFYVCCFGGGGSEWLETIRDLGRIRCRWEGVGDHQFVCVCVSVFCCLWDFRVDVVFIVCTWVRKCCCCCCCCRSCLLGRFVFRWDYGVIAKLADEREGYGKSLRVWFEVELPCFDKLEWDMYVCMCVLLLFNGCLVLDEGCLSKYSTTRLTGVGGFDDLQMHHSVIDFLRSSRCSNSSRGGEVNIFGASWWSVGFDYLWWNASCAWQRSVSCVDGLIVSGDEGVIGGCRWTTIFGAQRVDIDWTPAHTVRMLTRRWWGEAGRRMSPPMGVEEHRGCFAKGNCLGWVQL